MQLLKNMDIFYHLLLLQVMMRFFKGFYLFIFREGGREGESEGINVWLPLTQPPIGTWPATQVCALTGTQTRDTLVGRPALSHTN